MAAETAFGGPGELTVSVPGPGVHALRFENTGEDRVTVSKYSLVGLKGASALSGHGLRSDIGAYGCLYDIRFELDATGQPISGVRLALRDLADGEYSVSFTDPITGAVTQRPNVIVEGGQVELLLPSFAKEIACKLRRAGRDSKGVPRAP